MKTWPHQVLFEFGAVFYRSANLIQPRIQNKHQNWLICQKVDQIQLIHDGKKFQTKDMEIKLTVKNWLRPKKNTIMLVKEG